MEFYFDSKALLIQLLDMLPDAAVIIDEWQVCVYAKEERLIDSPRGIISKYACEEIPAIRLENKEVTVSLIDPDISLFKVIVNEMEFLLQVRDSMSIKFT